MSIRTLAKKLGDSNPVAHQIYVIAHNVKVRRMQRLDDVTYAKAYYKDKTGKYLNIESPQTFDEKLWWLKLHYRNPLETICSDKDKARQYVKECGLEHILNEQYGVWEDAREIDFDTLPSPCFLKCNHGSGTNIIYDKEKPFSHEKFVKAFNKSLKANYYTQSREWNYKNIEPRIVAERVLRDKKGNLPHDYKFLCFHGVPKLMMYDVSVCNEDGSHRPSAQRCIYDDAMNLLPDVKLTRERHHEMLDITREAFEEMKRYAAILSRPFPHVRVDFYCVDGKVYFGEMTFYHMGACNRIEPPDFAKVMGSWIDLDMVREEMNNKEYE